MIHIDQRWITRLLRFGFGLLLIFAAIDKIRHPFAFSEAVENYRLFGEDLSRWIAVWLPSFEVVLGFFLVLGIWQDASTLLNMILMSVFLVLVTQAYVRGLDIRCGCFFVEGDSKIGLIKIIENFLLAFLSILLYIIWKKESPIQMR